MIAVIVRIPRGGRGEGGQGVGRGGSDNHRPLGREEKEEGVLGLVGGMVREGACQGVIIASTGTVTGSDRATV